MAAGRSSGEAVETTPAALRIGVSTHQRGYRELLLSAKNPRQLRTGFDQVRTVYYRSSSNRWQVPDLPPSIKLAAVRIKRRTRRGYRRRRRRSKARVRQPRTDLATAPARPVQTSKPAQGSGRWRVAVANMEYDAGVSEATASMLADYMASSLGQVAGLSVVTRRSTRQQIDRAASSGGCQSSCLRSVGRSVGAAWIVKSRVEKRWGFVQDHRVLAVRCRRCLLQASGPRRPVHHGQPDERRGPDRQGPGRHLQAPIAFDRHTRPAMRRARRLRPSTQCPAVPQSSSDMSKDGRYNGSRLWNRISNETRGSRW